MTSNHRNVQEGKSGFPECVQNSSPQNSLYFLSSELSLLNNWFPQLIFLYKMFYETPKTQQQHRAAACHHSRLKASCAWVSQPEDTCRGTAALCQHWTQPEASCPSGVCMQRTTVHHPFFSQCPVSLNSDDVVLCMQTPGYSQFLPLHMQDFIQTLSQTLRALETNC